MASKKFSVVEGYIAWAICWWLPIGGLHRVYLGKANLFYLIPGLGNFLSFLDIIKIPSLVREANLRLEYKEALISGRDHFGNPTHVPQAPPRKSPEQIILGLAKKNRGIVTPSEVALEGDISIDEARKQLETLVANGFAEMKIRSSGAIAYTFPDFFDDAHTYDFEDI